MPLDELWAKSPLFALLDQDGKARLATIAQHVEFQPGAEILREGDPGEAFYVCLEGDLDVEAKDLADQPQAVAILGPGAVFGEIAALTREPRTATVRARTKVRALKLEIVSVFGILKDYPQILAALNRLGVARSENTLDKVLGR